MSSPSASLGQRSVQAMTPDAHQPSPSPVEEPTTPPPPLSLSQVALPSTEIPASPMDAGQSFQTEPLDDRPPPPVIPSSLTPPPSTQLAAHNASRPSLFSPPATVVALAREGAADSDPGFVPPAPQQVLDAPPDQLQAMLQTCIAAHKKLKMEAAHHKLQYNLLSLQADEDSKRAVVEHDMMRREVDALRIAEHTRQARRELSTSSDSTQAKYRQMKTWYQEAVQENDALRRRLKAAKRVIHQKEEKTISLSEERDLLLTRIRENREHFHMLCSPGGIFHGALTPKPHAGSTPPQHRLAPQNPSKAPRRDERHVPEPGLSALIQAMSAQDNDDSPPSTPMSSHRVVQRRVGKHGRNAQSMSSLPTTPLNRGHDPSLLPSVDLTAPHTEPRHRLAHQHMAPTTPRRDHRHKSRESTISIEDTEELARQAMESAAAAQSIASEALRGTQPTGRSRPGDGDGDGDDDDRYNVSGSRASQAAAELLRRNLGQRYGAMVEDRTPRPAEKSAMMQARLLSDSGGYCLDKRKYGEGGAGKDEHGSPPKKMRVGGPLTEDQRVGLGIQYGQ